jgi:DNA-binding transcriptional LysR family regulator
VVPPPRSAFEIANYSPMARLVREGLATTLAPESAISGDMLNGLCAIPVDDARLRWTLSTAVCTERRMTAAMTVILRALTQGSYAGAAQAPAVATV